MRRPVIALGLDAADPLLVERWMAAGQLPTLARLRANGVYTRLANFEYCRAESACTSFLTGCSPWRTGRWAPFKFDAATYGVENRQAYEFDEFPPFYALGDNYRVAMFDLPQTRVSDRVNGIQVLGWGAHSPRTNRTSVPPGLLEEITERFGEHPTYEKDHVTLWDERGMRSLREGLETGIARRAAVCRELLQRERWDLFLTYFGETHSAGHFFWHLSQPDHPLYESTSEGDPLLRTFQAVDRAVATILEAAPSDARVALFSDHGMEANSTDLPSLVFLPELLYRWNFPGRYGLEPGGRGEPPAPVKPRRRRSWTDEVWARKHDRNPITRTMRRVLPVEFFHYAVERRLRMNGVPLCPEDCRLGHQPPMWYHPAWPAMKAFALPSFSEGYVRINLRGRERAGIVARDDYSRICGEIEALLAGVRDARTGAPLVHNILRTRTDAAQNDPKLPDPDLIVMWSPRPTDVVDTPFGRIGPVPFQRTGSHVERGFLLAHGPGLHDSMLPPEPHALDLAPTILALLEAPIPAHLEGRPLFAPATGAPLSAVS